MARAEELFRLADELDPAERRERTGEILDGVGKNLRRISADLETIQSKLDERTEITEQTIYLPVHWGSPWPYVRAIEKAARSADVRCRTTVSRTGLLSREVAFAFEGKAIALDLLIAWVKDWANANGIGWTTY